MIGVQLFATRRAGATRAEVLRDLITAATSAERLGLDAVWLAEHHETDWNLTGDPLTLLAALAVHTNRIRLGAAVVNLALHDPGRVAEQAAMVNALSGGRLELGLGKGFAKSDYRRFQLDPADADRLFSDKLDRLLSLLVTDSDTASLPTWLSASGRLETIRRAAEEGHGLLLAATGEKLAGITRFAAGFAAPPKMALMRLVHTAPTRSEARDAARPYVAWYIDAMSRLQPGHPSPAADEVMDTFCLLGPGSDVLDQADQLRRRHGLAQVIAVPGVGGMPVDEVCSVLADIARSRPHPSQTGGAQ